jgi:tetratricopeptide (TPR) repeat protein
MPTISEALTTAAQQLQAGQFRAVEEICRQILVRDPSQADALHMLGVLAYQTGRYELAIEHINQAIRSRGTQAAFHASLGIVFQAQKDLDNAIACFRRALELEPNHAETHNNLGIALHDQEQLDQAAAEYRRAVALKPQLAAAHNNLGNILQTQRKHAAAVESYQRALELNPADAQANSNFANALRNLGRYDEALARYARALELKSDYAAAHCGRAMIQLLLGDFESGWPEYEWRWKTRQAAAREFSPPRWQGEELGARTILLYDEQGFGDTFQFVRFAHLVKAQNPAATVILECQRPLVNVLTSCSGVDLIIPRGDGLPTFDCHVPLLTLPAVFRTSLQTIPAAIPYLLAEPTLVTLWQERLRPLTGLRIGINWHGRPGTQGFSRRNIPLEDFAPLATLPGVHLVSLQIGEGREQLPGAIHQGLPIVDLGEQLDAVHGPFMDTAAVMMNLDLIITSDTSIPHLAGALGVPVWLVLPLIADWRWLLDRQDSPWYPTMRLFRQKIAGDWCDVIAELSGEVHRLLKASH